MATSSLGSTPTRRKVNAHHNHNSSRSREADNTTRRARRALHRHLIFSTDFPLSRPFPYDVTAHHRHCRGYLSCGGNVVRSAETSDGEHNYLASALLIIILTIMPWICSVEGTPGFVYIVPTASHSLVSARNILSTSLVYSHLS